MSKAVYPVHSLRGNELVRENTLSYGVNPITFGCVSEQGVQGAMSPIVSDVTVYDGLSRGIQEIRPYATIKWAKQPERRTNMYNVIHAYITDKTAGGIPFAKGSQSLQDFLSGGSTLYNVAFNQPNPLMPLDASYENEYTSVDSRWEEGLKYRTRTFSPDSWRNSTDLIAQAEPIMTEGYWDQSMTRTANQIQWNRGLDGPLPPPQMNTKKFVESLTDPTPSYAKIYSPYAMVG